MIVHEIHYCETIIQDMVYHIMKTSLIQDLENSNRNTMSSEHLGFNLNTLKNITMFSLPWNYQPECSKLICNITLVNK